MAELADVVVTRSHPYITIGSDTELGDDSFVCDNHRDHRGENAFVVTLEFSADCGRGPLPANGSGNFVVSTRLRPNEGTALSRRRAACGGAIETSNKLRT